MLGHYEREVKIINHFLKVEEEIIFKELYDDNKIHVRMSYEMFPGKVSSLDKVYNSYNEVLSSLAWRRKDMKTIFISRV